LNILAMKIVSMMFMLASILLAIECGPHPRADSQNPAWLTKLIQQQESQSVANPPASITRYEYNGQIVYFMPQQCCDIPSMVYDAKGNVICHPDGGISGKGDMRCPDFFEKRTNEKFIWKDARSYPPQRQK
jgi:hypothetical protein